MTFTDRVPDALARALATRGYQDLTPVQQAVLAAAPARTDMLVSARTGSGKTLAFGLAFAPLLFGPEGRVLPAQAPRALVITPTRELALQVREELAWLYAETGARIGCCTGGTDIRAERAALAGGVDVVVGSPGRLRDHIAHGALDAAALACVVLDEADDMLELGFRDDLEFILKAAPAGRQTLMFSATVTRQIETLAQRYQRETLRIDAGGATGGHGDIAFQAIMVAPDDREGVIVNVLRLHEARSAIVFCGRRETVGDLTGRLQARGFRAVALSGALEQKDRTAALAAMRDGRAQVCVATDVAARGLDLPGLDLVVHADLPLSRENLLHRSGRTGRAGRKGLSVLVVPHPHRRRAYDLIARAGIAIDWVAAPRRDDILARDRVRMLSDPALTAPATDEERAVVAALLAAHDAQRLAVAFYRRWGGQRPAPVAVVDGKLGPDQPQRRFDGGVWFSLNQGRRSHVEICSILPLLCRSGRVARRDVGRIRVFETETQFEIRRPVAEGFEAAFARHAEPGLAIRRLVGRPARLAGARPDQPRPPQRGPGGV